MEVVCLDTQILYWGIIGKAAPGAESFIAPAIDFLKWLNDQDVRVVVPTIVVAEMLVPIPEYDHPDVLSKFRADWMIVEFDLRAASIFARMRYDHVVNKRMQDIRSLHPDVTKKELVADVMIIATAISHGATKLYSHNVDMRKLAEGHIVVQSFDDVQFQISMDLEIEEDEEDVQ